MALEIVKYQGTNNFLTILLKQKEYEKYYFVFMKTHEPQVEVNVAEIPAIGKQEQTLMFFDENNLSFSVEGKTWGKDKRIYGMLEIKRSDFDSLYKLLESVWNE